MPKITKYFDDFLFFFINPISVMIRNSLIIEKSQWFEFLSQREFKF